MDSCRTVIIGDDRAGTPLTSYFSPARRSQVSTFRQKGEIDGSIGVRVNWYRYTTSFSKFALWTVGFISFSFLAGAAAASELVAPSPPSPLAAGAASAFSSGFLSAAVSPPPAAAAAAASAGLSAAAGAAAAAAAAASTAGASTFFSSSPATTGLFSVSVAIFALSRLEPPHQRKSPPTLLLLPSS
uniref:Uncharacterized protein n=1 Tax=Anopheles merus TaxID=30066 RepID=A0A182V1Z4_ANOME